MTDLKHQFKATLRDVEKFAAGTSGLTLRGYQAAIAHAIAKSVSKGWGLSFVVMFPRQSGKNEVQAQIEAYLLTLFSETNAEIVKVSPTWKPQSLNAMRRLERTSPMPFHPMRTPGAGTT